MLPEIDPPLRKLEPAENIYGVPLFDCHGVTRSVMASPSDPQAAQKFEALRSTDGQEYRRPLPPDFQVRACDLRYPPATWSDGPLFKAHPL